MKKAVAAVCVLFLLLSSAASAYNGDTTVYVTKTGECYHVGTCSYLKSEISISLEDAVANGYRACSRCNPPRLDSTRSAQPTAPIATLPPVKAKPAPTPTPNPIQPVETIQPIAAATSPPETRVIVQPTSVAEAKSERTTVTAGIVGIGIGAGAVALFSKKKRGD